MHDRVDLKKHAALVDSVSNALNVSLEDAVLRGDVRARDLADIVLRCAECTNVQECQDWVSEARDAAKPPKYCRNFSLFEELVDGGASRR